MDYVQCRAGVNDVGLTNPERVANHAAEPTLVDSSPDAAVGALRDVNDTRAMRRGRMMVPVLEPPGCNSPRVPCVPCKGPPVVVPVLDLPAAKRQRLGLAPHPEVVTDSGSLHEADTLMDLLGVPASSPLSFVIASWDLTGFRFPNRCSRQDVLTK